MFVDRNLLISSQEIFVLPKFRTFKCTGQLKWNLDITKGQGTGKICSLYRGFVISRFFSTYFTITGVKNAVRNAEDFVI